MEWVENITNPILLKDFVPTSRITQQIEWSIQFYLRHGDLFHFRNVDECGGFPLDYQVLKDDETLQAVWPQLSEDLYDTPVSTLAAFSLAFYQVFQKVKLFAL